MPPSAKVIKSDTHSVGPTSNEPGTSEARGLTYSPDITMTCTVTRYIGGKPVAEKHEFIIRPYNDGYEI